MDKNKNPDQPQHRTTPQHGPEQGREVPGFNHEGYAEAEVISPAEGEENRGKGHGPLKGTDTLATTDPDVIEREKGKRTTM